MIGPPTLVLGSSQSYAEIQSKVEIQSDVEFQSDVQSSPGAAPESQDDLQITRRASGGGAVHVAPDAQAWVDVWLPRGDPLWDDDVIRSSLWLGSAWQSALGDLGVEDLEVNNGRLSRDRWSDVICFAGLGPGEVRWKNRKLVGLAQRRTRAGARFHTMSPVHQVAVPVLKLPGSDPAYRHEVDSVLAARSTCLVEAMDLSRAEDVEIRQVVERVVQSVASAIRSARDSD